MTNDHQEEPPALILYDGECGFCHGSVRFVVERDREGRFIYCPIQNADKDGKLFDTYGDTIVVVTQGGETYVRSDAAIYILKYLGGSWRTLGITIAIFPKFIRDLGYRFVAMIRRMLTRKPDAICPILPPDLRGRFLDEPPHAYALNNAISSL